MITWRTNRSSSMRNTIARLSVYLTWQVAGQVLPLAATVLAVSVMMHRLIAEDFGIFALALSGLGLLAVLDLGLGRATVRFVARALQEKDKAHAARLTAQSAALMLGFSLLLIAATLPFAPLAAMRWSNGEPDVAHRLEGVLRALICGLPAIAVASVIRSYLEAREDFRAIALIQGGVNTVTFIVPVLASAFTTNIQQLIAAAVITRSIALPLLAWRASRTLSKQDFYHGLSSLPPRDFLTFASWLMVSNLLGTTIVYADRAVVANLIPLDTLAYYNVPLEMLLRLTIVINGAIIVAFPLLSRVSVHQERLDNIGTATLSGLATLFGPLLLLVSLASQPALNLWLGKAFAQESTPLVRILLVGLFCLSLNAFSMATLNARGISGRIAVIHVIELPFYLYALHRFGAARGLQGIALVWSGRMVLEYLSYSLIQLAAATNKARFSKAALLGALQVIPLVATAGGDHFVLAAAMSLALSVFGIRQTIQELRSANV